MLLTLSKTLFYAFFCSLLATSSFVLAQSNSPTTPDSKKASNLRPELKLTKQFNIALHNNDPVSKFIFEQLADKFHFNVSFTTYTSLKSALRAVEDEEQDFLGGVFYSKEKSRRFDFSTPTNIEQLYWITNTINNTLPLIDTNADFSNKTVAINPDIIPTEKLNKHFKSENIVHFEYISEALILISSGKADFAIGLLTKNTATIDKRYYVTPMKSDAAIHPVSIVAKKQKYTKLIRQFENYISTDQMQQRINKIIYEIEYITKLNVIKKELQDSKINLDKTYRVKLELRPPFVFYENGKLTGLVVEAITDTCNLLKIKCKVVNEENESWASMLASFTNEEIDILSPFTNTLERSKTVYFSHSLHQGEMVIIKRKGYKDNVYKNVYELFSEKIGVVKNSYGHILLKQVLPQKRIAFYKNVDEVYKAIEDGEINYTTATKTFINNRVKSNTHLDLVFDEMIGGYQEVNINVGFQKTTEGEKLTELFNLAFGLINLDNLKKKYIPEVNYLQRLSRQKSRQTQIIISFSIVILALIFITLKFRKLSLTDELTQLGNRRKLLKSFPQKLPSDKTLILLELKNFKEINNILGSSECDHIVTSIAKLLPKICIDASFYRMGLNKFVIIGSYNKVQLNQIYNKIKKLKIAPKHTYEQHIINTHIVCFSENTVHNSFEEVLGIIYVAMSRLKINASNDVFEINNQIVKEYSKVVTFRQDLRKAISNKQLTAYLQPIIDLKNRKVVGLEGLSRWQYKETLLTPVHYFEELKALKLEADLDFLMIEILDDVFQHLIKEQLITEDFQININITSHSLRQSSRLFEALNLIKTPAKNLCIEILEDTVITDKIFDTMITLTEMGFKLAIDDFGSGFVSIEHLKSTYISKVKLDRSLLPSSTAGYDIDLIVLKSAIAMLRHLDKRLVMEGVENEEQVKLLLNEGVSFAQGFYFAKPMKLTDFIQYMKKEPRKGLF